MRRGNKTKGFSLIELLVSLAIIGVLAAVLIPALSGSFDKSKEKSDIVAIQNLASATQTSAQGNSIYNSALKIARKSPDDKIVMVYYVENDVVTFDYSYITSGETGSIKSSDEGEFSNEMKKFNDKILSSVGGKVEPIELKSKLYKNKSYEIILHFPDVNFKVDMEMKVNDKYR